MSDQLADMQVHHEVRSTTTDLEGLVWDIRSDEVVYGETILTRQYLSHRGAVAIVALDEDDRVLLIRQYRHPIRAREWELPAGILDAAKESPISAARRELLEETGLAAANWELLLDFFPTPGGSNEAVRVFLARGLETKATDFRPTGEEVNIELRWVPLDDAVTAILDRKTQNGTLAVAVLAAFAAKVRGRTNATSADAPWDRHPSASLHH
ncbi:NUDIX domain-containing protein [Cryobacterium flavum]|nr:NUDIX hydrolase [Cryobacterium flavum]